MSKARNNAIRSDLITARGRLQACEEWIEKHGRPACIERDQLAGTASALAQECTATKIKLIDTQERATQWAWLFAIAVVMAVVELGLLMFLPK